MKNNEDAMFEFGFERGYEKATERILKYLQDRSFDFETLYAKDGEDKTLGALSFIKCMIEDLESKKSYESKESEE